MLMQGNVIEKMCEGIDDSYVIVVFVTQRYIDKVGGKYGSQDNCKKEFEYAERTKGADKFIPVIMEPSVRDSRNWIPDESRTCTLLLPSNAGSLHLSCPES